MSATFGGKPGFLDSSFTLSYLFTVEIFQTSYGFSPGIAGLAYLGFGFGFVVAATFAAKFGDHIYRQVSLDLLYLPS
jgi:predicted MFS family arabinose efflux permease